LSDLTELPNVGKTLAQKLQRIGVSNCDQLAALGSVEAIIRIGHATESRCYNTLYALEGAIQGVRWHSFPGKARQELKNKLDAARER
jgi:DNA transformation protein